MGKTQPDPTIPWTHMGEIDITRENHSDGYTGKQSDTPRKTQSGRHSNTPGPTQNLGYTWTGEEKQPGTLIALDTFKKFIRSDTLVDQHT